jgi:hypothetical protein
MGNLLENIKEAREELDGFLCGVDVAMTDEERKVAAGIERKLAEVEKEISVFFSGKV